MDQYLQTLIKDFKGGDLKDFSAYIYTTLQKKIDVSKGKHKNKYIKIRDSILNYIFSNERAIVSELHKKVK